MTGVNLLVEIECQELGAYDTWNHHDRTGYSGLTQETHTVLYRVGHAAMQLCSHAAMHV